MVSVERDSQDGVLSLPNPYEIVSIRSVNAPKGSAGADWHRYEICQGGNQIVGYRAGGIESVTQAVEQIVFRLNERRKMKRGRVHVVLQSNFLSKATKQ